VTRRRADERDGHEHEINPILTRAGMIEVEWVLAVQHAGPARCRATTSVSTQTA
jgi:hypothetical protein